MDGAISLPGGVDILLAPLSPPAIVWQRDGRAILVDASRYGWRGDDRNPLYLSTDRPRAGSRLAALRREPSLLHLGMSHWTGWDVKEADVPQVEVLCVGDADLDGVAIHIPGCRMLVLGNAAIVPTDTQTASLVNRTLRAALGALDAEGVDRVCGTDPRLRSAPFGDDARAVLLSMLSETRSVLHDRPPEHRVTTVSVTEIERQA